MRHQSSVTEVHSFLRQSAVTGAITTGDPLSPNALLHINASLLETGSTPAAPTPENESPDVYRPASLPPAGAFVDYTIDEGEGDYDYGTEPAPVVPVCEGFTGRYYLPDKPLTSFLQLEGLTPTITRTDK